MTIPTRRNRTPTAANTEPPFDFSFPSSRQKKTMKANTDDSSRNEIDPADRTLMKSFRKVMTPHPRFADPLPASQGEGERPFVPLLPACGEKVAEGRMRGSRGHS